MQNSLHLTNKFYFMETIDMNLFALLLNHLQFPKQYYSNGIIIKVLQFV